MPDLSTLLAAAVPWLYLAIVSASAAVTLNAFVPIRRNELLLVPSFLFGTVAVELAAFGVVLHVLLGAGVVATDTHTTPVAKVAMGLSVITVLGLLGLVWQGFGAGKTISDALAPILGRPMRAPSGLWRLLVPFPLRVATSRVTRNVCYARTAGTSLRLDVYHPRVEGTQRPAVLYVHGGGWVVGDKREQGVPLMSILSDRGFVGFSVNYRLSPGATWPDHLVDVKRAVAWVRSQAEVYGVDPARIAICGGSAGGHLASMVGLTADDRSLQPGFGEADTSVGAVASLYGVYDLTNASKRQPDGFHRRLLQPLVMKAFYDEEPERFANASPLHRVVADAPPFFIIHGDRDNLAPLEDARDFANAMQEVSQRPVVFAEIRGAQHSFDFFVSPRSLPVLEGVSEFFEHALGEAAENPSGQPSTAR